MSTVIEESTGLQTPSGALDEASPVDYDSYGTIYQPRGDALKAPFGPGADSTVYPFRNRIDPDGEFPPEVHRYHLYVSLACPFAQRTLIVRALKGLAEAVGVSIVDPVRDGRGWAFRSGPGHTLDRAGNGFTLLCEAYAKSSPSGVYTGRVSVPVLWDTRSHQVVSNYYPETTLDLGSQFNQWATHPELDLYPVHRRDEIDSLNSQIGPHLNEGVYHAGFATGQEDYHAGYREVFETLDLLEDRLADGRSYLVGDQITEADVRLWPTLARFDSVYHGHFKLNRNRLTDFTRLWAYTRRLHAIPAFGGTLDLDQIRRHYYGTQRHINPTGIVPPAPAIDWSI